MTPVDPLLRLRGLPWRVVRRAFWPWFRLGYITALDDVERTGLRPTRERTKEYAARRAWERSA